MSLPIRLKELSRDRQSEVQPAGHASGGPARGPRVVPCRTPERIEANTPQPLGHTNRHPLDGDHHQLVPVHPRVRTCSRMVVAGAGWAPCDHAISTNGWPRLASPQGSARRRRSPYHCGDRLRSPLGCACACPCAVTSPAGRPAATAKNYRAGSLSNSETEQLLGA